jgi:DNA-binding transcriptional ArsR family regulator
VVESPSSPHSAAALYDAAYAALAHPGRRAILHLLASQGDMTPTQLFKCFPGMLPQTVRFHLDTLRKAGLVLTRAKAGKGPRCRSGVARCVAVVNSLAGADQPDGREILCRLNRKPFMVLQLDLSRLSQADTAPCSTQ